MKGGVVGREVVHFSAPAAINVWELHLHFFVSFLVSFAVLYNSQTVGFT